MDMKKRDKIIEKNEKLRQLKKAEEIVPYVDPISRDDAAKKFYRTSYSNLKYMNLAGNSMKAKNTAPVLSFLEKNG